MAMEVFRLQGSFSLPVTLEEVTVYFTKQEWTLLDLDQKVLHREVTEEISHILSSLSKASSFLWLLNQFTSAKDHGSLFPHGC
uniref:KRAB domain-containing protein n=1 Tax=Varanus komodoensis TaxID=61221 RepID=A0A8D2Q3G3_VARKO